MGLAKKCGQFLVAASRAHAQWELETSRTILGDKKRLAILGLLLVPIILGGVAFADQLGDAIPQFIGGK
ncbi:MAG: hypothetical protein LDL11_03405, partial [Desulfarculus sp.]|nr:hypothetical protein [Desulfarculus sp.]